MENQLFLLLSNDAVSKYQSKSHSISPNERLPDKRVNKPKNPPMGKFPDNPSRSIASQNPYPSQIIEYTPPDLVDFKERLMTRIKEKKLNKQQLIKIVEMISAPTCLTDPALEHNTNAYFEQKQIPQDMRR